MMGSEGQQPVFDLVREPWLPVVAPDGSRLRLSLREIFARAHELNGLSHPVPIIELGAWRLLIAIATDVLAPRDVSELAVLLERTQFTMETFDAYFSKWRERFDLFGARHPFLQHAHASGEAKSLAALSPLVPSGTNTIHWHKRSDDALGACPACAALMLTTIAPAMTAGGAGLSPSINGAPPYYCLLVGPTLMHSILLNVWADAPAVLRGGSVSWRSDRRPDPTSRAKHATLLEAYTWQPRTVRLLPGEGGECAICGSATKALVRTMYFGKGDSCDFANWRDPNVAYTSGKDKTSPLRPREDREPWRDVDALLLLQHRGHGSKRTVERPRVVTQLALLREEGSALARSMKVRLIGMRTDLKMKVFEWLAQDLVLPLPIAPNERQYNTLVRLVSSADAVQRALASAITNATRRPAFDHRDLARSLVVPAGRRFWGSLDQPFRATAAAIAGRDPGSEGARLEEDEHEWKARCARMAQREFQSAVERLAHNACQLIATERARAGLDRYLARVLGGAPIALGGQPT